MFRFSACAGTDMEDCIVVDNHSMPCFSEPLSFTTNHSYTLAHITRQGDHITDRRPFTPQLSVHRCIIPLLEMKPTPEKSKTMISHDTTMSLITEQTKSNKGVCVFSCLVFIHDSVRGRSPLSSSPSSVFLKRRAIPISPLPHNPVHCALYLPPLWSAAQSHGRKTLHHTASDVQLTP